MSSSPSFFERFADAFDPFGTAGIKKLRNCQLGAYWAVWAHFSASTEPALVSLPTGSGKTALMMALAFGLRARRVLAVNPSRLLRDQTADEFNSLALLKSIGTLQKHVTTPQVHSNEDTLNTKQRWTALQAFDVVTATPRTTSPAQPGVCAPVPDLFDLVFLDEAHHAPAKTWAALLKSFRSAKCVLLTATPFREDRRRLGARLVYHYSIARALRDGIYRPVKYHPIKAPSNRGARDNALCAQAKKVLNAEHKAGNDVRILARAANVDWSTRLVGVYQKHGIAMGAVDYLKSATENQQVIDDVKAGRLQGMVCVGMLGEGIDVPTLKVAVLHAAPRSLPFTLQFVGRVSRTTAGQIGDAHLLSVPAEVTGEMQRLHRNDADWRELIPQLADEVLGKSADYRHFRSSYSLDDLDVNPGLFKPFCSVRAFTVSGKLSLPKGDLQPPKNAEICFLDADTLTNGVIVVTEIEEPPAWATDTRILEPRYDLHVYVQAGNLVFESTTWGVASNQLLTQMVVQARPVDGARLTRAMHSGNTLRYFNIGLRNATASSSAQPAYKTLAGDDVETTVMPTEGRIFGPGHVLANIDATETRGVATENARVWAIKRATIADFSGWCEQVARSLRATPPPGLPQLEFLASSTSVGRITEKPLAILMDHRVLQAAIAVTGSTAARTLAGDLPPYIDILSLKKGLLTCSVEFAAAEPGCVVTFDPNRYPYWQYASGPMLQFTMLFANGNKFDGDVQDFLQAYPPSLLMPSGAIVLNGEKTTPNLGPMRLPDEVLQVQDWSGCDVGVEVGKARKGRKNIHDWLEAEIKKTATAEAIIIKDHGKGELADFVVLEPNRRNRRVVFYHCKASTGNKPSDRVKDVEEVLSQACRSAQWLFRPNLAQMLVTQTSPSRSSPILRGARQRLSDLSTDFQPNSWSYKVIAVQPGVKASDVLASPKIGFLVATSYATVRGANSDFELWSS